MDFYYASSILCIYISQRLSYPVLVSIDKWSWGITSRA